MRTISAHVAAMIRIDEIWLATEPLDMRAGPDTALARVVQVFGSAKSQRAYDLARWAKKMFDVATIAKSGVVFRGSLNPWGLLSLKEKI